MATAPQAIHFQARWVPDQEHFLVEFVAMGHVHKQVMSVEEYECFCSDLERDMTIGGFRIAMSGSGDLLITKRTRRTLIQYFRDVLMSYMDARAKGKV